MTDNAIIKDTSANPDYAVIWMHGLGADGNDFLPIVNELDLQGLGIRFIFPHAPIMPVTINMGMRMPAWYDIRQPQLNQDEDHDGIKQSHQRVSAMLESLKQQGIAASNTVLAGFSQGGAMSLYCGLRHHEALAGIMALSCYLPLAERLTAEANPQNQTTPIFMAHGSQDPVVAYATAEQSLNTLRDAGYTVEWHEYAMPHSVCMEEINDIGAWLRSLLKRS